MTEVNLSVTLVRATAQADELVASAAKLCYAANTNSILECDSARASEFVTKLRELGHLSPLEHISFTFYVEGVSRAMTHQLVRHRIASYSQRSQRYVKHDAFDYIVPPQMHGRRVATEEGERDAVEYFRETMEVLAQRYRRLRDALGDEGERSNEDARYVLPNACETRIFVTMNARELMHFFEERLCQRAQWEIRAMAERMHAIARDRSPAVFAGIGPKCVRLGRCPEGKMTCGKYAEMREKYGDTPLR